MSSGVEASIALDAAVVLSLGMTRMLGGAAGLAAGGAGSLAELADAKADAREAALAAAASYEQVLRGVLDRNARIAAVAESGRRTGTHLDLPAPLDLPERPAEELTAERLTAWCATADEVLAAAERQISERLAERAAAQIFEAPAGPETSEEHPSAASSAAAPDAMPDAMPDTTPDVAPDVAPDAADTLRRVLGRLPYDVADDDRSAVVEAAGRLADARTASEAEDVLSEVRLRVQEAVRRAERRREAERRLAAEREAAEQAAAERRYLLDTIAAAFQEMGYEVDAGFETMTARDGAVRLTKDSWPDHSVRLGLDAGASESTAGPGGAPVLRAAMIRGRAPQGEEDRRVDVEREREWCAAFEAARERLTASGVRSDVTWRIEPGEQELPVARRARHTRDRVGKQERRRERSHEP